MVRSISIVIFILFALAANSHLLAQSEKIISSCIPYEVRGEAWDVFEGDILPAIMITRICVARQDYLLLMSDTISIQLRIDIESKYVSDTYFLLRDNNGNEINQYDLFYVEVDDEKYYFSYGLSEYSLVFLDGDKRESLISVHQFSEQAKYFGNALVDIISYKDDQILDTLTILLDNVPSDILQKMKDESADKIKLVVRNSRHEISMLFKLKYFNRW